MNPYAVLTVAQAPRSLEDELTAILFEAGAEGVSEDLPFVQKDLRYDPDLVAGTELKLKAYFATPPTESARLALETELRALHPKLSISLALEEHKDWLEEWKKGFSPFCMAEPFWIVPRWLPVPTELRSRPQHVILMEPGMAFGTGTHETTKLASAMIVAAMGKRGRDTAVRVLDVGTGTGILALLTERMGAREAVGLDIDPEARRTARENLELNRSTITRIDDRDLDVFVKGEGAAFDIVIANIIDGVLMVLAKNLAAAVKPGGTLVLSGILTDRSDEFHASFAKLTGLREQSRTSMGEWVASTWLR